MSEKNPFLDYQLITYANPHIYKVAVALAATQSLNRSQVVGMMMGEYVNKNLNQAQQNKLKELYEKMTPEQRRNPQRYYDTKEDEEGK